MMTSDHGAGWGHGMEWNVVGDYLPESTPGSSSFRGGDS